MVLYKIVQARANDIQNSAKQLYCYLVQP